MKTSIGNLHMMWLMKSPTALFSRLFELPWYRGMLEQWAAPLQKNDASVLEVGCAAGDFSRLLAQRNMRVSAVDSSSKMLERAQKTASPVLFRQADAMQLPFSEQQFDIVMAASVLNVVDSPIAVLSEMRRVCREGGTVSVLVPEQSFSDADAKLAAEPLSGISRAALLAWHRMAPKMDADVLLGYFEECGMLKITSDNLLGGMVVAVSGNPVISHTMPAG